MSAIRYELINAIISRANISIDTNIYDDIHKQFEFKRKTILADKCLTKNEKTVAIRMITKDFDRFKIIYNEGTKRMCENCNQECFATLYCEHCVRNYLKANFSNWTSGNNDIDDLIQKCQMETLMPSKVVEWIPYNNLQNIECLTKGEFSEIYTADWIGGYYDEWDSKKQQLKRVEQQNLVTYVVLKRLENVENANQSWFEEAKSHLVISNKRAEIVKCFGLTQDSLNGSYMLVMYQMDMDLRKYLQQNHHQLTWKEKIEITCEIILALYFIHEEKAIHKDLHSGNVLYSQYSNCWRISDLGFCGPADKLSKSIYGNLPYIAPEVINGKEYTFKSDIYSIAILMWEISSGQPPFINYEHDYNLAINIINGIRPKIASEIPLEYKSLIEQCWNADPSKRPDIQTLWKKVQEINLYYQNMTNKSNKNKNFIKKFFKNFNLSKSKANKANKNLEVNNKISDSLITNYASTSGSFTSKIHNFKNLPEPRNATEEEQEAFHSKPYSFNIPDNINDFNSSNQNNNDETSRTSSKLSKEFDKLQINSKNDYKEETTQTQITQQQIRRNNININNDETYDYYDNPNFHPEEQNDLEIPDEL